jgi:rhomboid family GlyGly-CTERM serine protease
VLAFVWPTLGTDLVLQADCLRTGEWWRLWTGHGVHFSVSHLAWDLSAVLMLSLTLERTRKGVVLRYYFWAAPCISLGLLVLCPDMIAYGGLSGLATGLVTLLALVWMARPAPSGWWGVLLGTLVVGKFGWEVLLPGAGFSNYDSSTIRTEPAAHLLGIATALAYAAISIKPTHEKMTVGDQPSPPPDKV